MNTPDTDKAWKEYIESGLEEKLRDASARIETERNEARKQRDELQIMNDQLCEAVEKTFPKIESIVKQRDDLLAVLIHLRSKLKPGDLNSDDDDMLDKAIANVKGETV